MVSKSESTHATNVANFEKLLIACTSYGAAYNPTKTQFKLPQLITLNNAANSAMQAEKVAKQKKDIDVDKRKVAFEGIKKLSTRIVNALRATDATAETLENAVGYNRKLQGQRSSALPEPTIVDGKSIEPDTKSDKQQSKVSLIDHFAKLILTAGGEPTYLPSEATLKITSLNTVLSGLKAANSVAEISTVAHENTLIARDKVLYAPKTGLKTIALDVKAYVKSVFGPDSQEYRMIKSLSFRDYKRPGTL